MAGCALSLAEGTETRLDDFSPGAFPLNDAIIIRGARTHNLKNISCEIPHGKLTVVSGVSGSGKSSLAFDTIYAEGQRRYVESLSAYARQFLERIEKPDVDEIDGLAPAIAIKQKNSTRNPRSTVATATEIYDYLRLLVCALRDGALRPLRRAGEARFGGRGGRGDSGAGRGNAAECAVSGAERNAVAGNRSRRAAKTAKAAGRAAKSGAKAKPVVSGGDSPHTETLKARLAELRSSGFNRLWQQGKIVEFSTPESLLDLDFHASSVYSFGPDCGERGEPRAHCGCRGDRLPRGRRGDLRRGSARGVGGAQAAALFRRVRVQELPPAGQASRSRGCSASTIRSGPARAARASATRSIST